MEFSLEPDVGRPYGLRAVGLLVLAAFLGVVGLSGNTPVAVLGAVIAVAALFAGVRWYARLRALTLVGPEGVRTRMLRTRAVAWAEVKQIQVVDFEKVRDVRVARGASRGGTRRTSGGGQKKVACVRIVRHRGRTVELAAPLIIRASSDSKFDDKVRALRAAHAFYVKADPVPADRPAR
jgi:hypothetical protein